MAYETNVDKLVTFPVDMAGNAMYYLKLDRQNRVLKVYERTQNFDLVNRFYPLDKNFDVRNDVPFLLKEDIPVLYGGSEGSQTPKGIYKVHNVSKKHQEYVSGFNPNYGTVKLFGYIEIYEYYWIHSNMYVGEDVNESNFMSKEDKIVHGNYNPDGTEHTSGCIRIQDQAKLDELMEYIQPGDIVDTTN